MYTLLLYASQLSGRGVWGKTGGWVWDVGRGRVVGKDEDGRAELYELQCCCQPTRDLSGLFTCSGDVHNVRRQLDALKAPGPNFQSKTFTGTFSDLSIDILKLH